jgi:hypothetical protein
MASVTSQSTASSLAPAAPPTPPQSTATDTDLPTLRLLQALLQDEIRALEDHAAAMELDSRATDTDSESSTSQGGDDGEERLISLREQLEAIRTTLAASEAGTTVKEDKGTVLDTEEPCKNAEKAESRAKEVLDLTKSDDVTPGSSGKRSSESQGEDEDVESQGKKQKVNEVCFFPSLLSRPFELTSSFRRSSISPAPLPRPTSLPLHQSPPSPAPSASTTADPSPTPTPSPSSRLHQPLRRSGCTSVHRVTTISSVCRVLSATFRRGLLVEAMLFRRRVPACVSSSSY